MKNYIIISTLSILMIFSACSSDINFTRSDAEYDGSYEDGGNGKGGSMARFTILGNHLYAVDDRNLIAFDISNPNQMELSSKKNLDWGIETIFPMNDKLLLGTRTGMIIMDVSNPNNIQQLSKYEHVVSCDPVVAQGNYAYVTLRSNQFQCNRGVNQLQVIDISNLLNPKQLRNFPMTSPKGLGIDDDLLFVCDGDYLKVFDAKDPVNLVQINSVMAEGAYDVIPYKNHLILIGEEGLKQYTYENSQLTLLSTINTNN